MTVTNVRYTSVRSGGYMHRGVAFMPSATRVWLRFRLLPSPNFLKKSRRYMNYDGAGIVLETEYPVSGYGVRLLHRSWAHGTWINTRRDGIECAAFGIALRLVLNRSNFE